MSLLEQIKQLAERKPTDVVALDCAADGVRAARLRQTPGGIRLVAAGLLPPVPGGVAADGIGRPQTEDDDIAELELPPSVRGRYATLLAPGGQASIKLLRLPEDVDLSDRAQLLKRLGLAANEYRIGTLEIEAGSGKREALVLGAGLRESVARSLLGLLPKAGLPAPRALETSELAVLNAFAVDPRFSDTETPCGFIHFDHDFSLVALFNRGRLLQLRTFSFGLAAVNRRIMKALNVDQVTAAGVLNDGAFDISHLVEEETREVRGQYVISRDFMERSENCRLQHVHLSGPTPLTKPFAKGKTTNVEMNAWSVLDLLDGGLEGEIPETLRAAPWPLTAAIGAAWGLLTQ